MQGCISPLKAVDCCPERVIASSPRGRGKGFVTACPEHMSNGRKLSICHRRANLSPQMPRPDVDACVRHGPRCGNPKSCRKWTHQENRTMAIATIDSLEPVGLATETMDESETRRRGKAGPNMTGMEEATGGVLDSNRMELSHLHRGSVTGFRRGSTESEAQ